MKTVTNYKEFKNLTDKEKEIYFDLCCRINEKIKTVIVKQGAITFIQLMNILLHEEVVLDSYNAAKRELEQALNSGIELYYEELKTE